MKVRKQISTLAAIFLMVLPVTFLTALGGKEPEEKKLVIYTYDAFPGALEESIRNKLESGGNKVDLIRFEDAGAVMARVLLEKNAPKADVVIGLDNTYLAKAFEEDLFLKYKPAGLSLVHEGLLVDPEYRLIPFDYGSIALNYDSEMLTDPPRSWNELLDPKYKNKIILMNPTTSSPGRNL